MTITICGEELILDEERALFLPRHRLLVISDLHLGKAAHFRKAGLAVPSTLAQNDLHRLAGLFDKYMPETLLITGDMFHHSLNTDIAVFETWRQNYTTIQFLLVKGNHDRLQANDYARLSIDIEESHHCLEPFCFIHHAPDYSGKELYPISGHIHPGVSLVGKAKQRMRFPCFYFGADYAILPAFSLFTGLATVYPAKNDRIFAVMPGQVIEVKQQVAGN